MMIEFLLWSNCNNNCKFCWQNKIHDLSTILNEEEMLDSLKQAISKIKEIKNGDDLLIVGGEVLADYYYTVDKKLDELFVIVKKKMERNEIRYFYINTNLLYDNLINVTALMNIFIGMRDRIKFTTSYDVYGRFDNEDAKKLFFENIRVLKEKYPDINIVVNSILTKQLIDNIITGEYNYKQMIDEYNLSYINLIPYIPVKDDNSMNTNFNDIIKALSIVNQQDPGYIKHYIDDFDLNQNKILYEYHKDKGYVECTAEYNICGHNKNFMKVLNGECYICKLKDMFTNYT